LNLKLSAAMYAIKVQVARHSRKHQYDCGRCEAFGCITLVETMQSQACQPAKAHL